ncbi:FmdB family zinc ribbon protein [Thiohalocapsa halophila]
MPIYAYRCEACGHELDALQKISDAPLTDCPACGAAALKKQLTAAAFRLKGGGWYETDFKKDGKKNLHDSGDKDKPKEGKDTATGDNKGAADTSKKKDADKPAAKPAGDGKAKAVAGPG